MQPLQAIMVEDAWFNSFCRKVEAAVSVYM